MTTGLDPNNPEPVIRAFIAIEVSDAVREALVNFNRRLEASVLEVRWTKSENLHLTLCFLGDIKQAQLNRVDDFLALTSYKLRSLRIRVHGLGVFPDLLRPRTLWTGIQGESEALEGAYSLAQHAARAAGVTADKRDFHPHITLGRIRKTPTAAVSLLLERERNFTGGEFTARHVSLFRSTLTADGARYFLIGKHPFK